MQKNIENFLFGKNLLVSKKTGDNELKLCMNAYRIVDNIACSLLSSKIVGCREKIYARGHTV